MHAMAYIVLKAFMEGLDLNYNFKYREKWEETGWNSRKEVRRSNRSMRENSASLIWGKELSIISFNQPDTLA